jgi:hypothetical protein
MKKILLILLIICPFKLLATDYSSNAYFPDSVRIGNSIRCTLYNIKKATALPTPRQSVAFANRGDSLFVWQNHIWKYLNQSQGDTTVVVTINRFLDSISNVKDLITIERNAKNDSILAIRNLANNKTIYANNGLRKDGDTIKLDNGLNVASESVIINVDDNVIGLYSDNSELNLGNEIRLQSAKNTTSILTIDTGYISIESQGEDIQKNYTFDTTGLYHDAPFDTSLLTPLHFVDKSYVDSKIINSTEQTYVYAGTSPDGYILRSSDNGLTWTNLGSAGKGQPLAFCQISNGDLLYTTSLGYVVNYTKNTNIKVSNYAINSIIAYDSYSEPGVWVTLLGDDNGDIYYSNELGFVWSKLNSYVGNGTKIHALHYINSNGNLLSLTTNGIKDWEGDIIQSGHFIYALQIPNTDTIYALTYAGNIFRSINAGTSWSDLGDQGAANSRFIAKGLGSRIIIGYGSTVMIYSDNGFSTIGYLSSQEPEAKCLITTGNRMIIGQSDTEGNGGKISYSDNNGVAFTDLGQQYSQDSINCIIAVTGSTYVQSGDLTIYETKVQHAEDTTLQRAWMNGLEARKVNISDTINRNPGSYITPTQAANIYLAKIDTNHFVNENDTIEANYKLLTRTQNYYNTPDTVSTDMTNVYLVTFSKSYREHRIDTLSGNATVTITKSALAKPGAIEVFYSRGTGAAKTINFGSCKNSCLYEYDDTAGRMNVITFKLCTGGIIERCVYQRY